MANEAQITISSELLAQTVAALPEGELRSQLEALMPKAEEPAEDTVIDLSLENASLYEGCEITEAGGRKNLATPQSEAVNIVGRNINAMMEAVSASNRKVVVLTGPMAVWSYLVVFHAVVHRFDRVYYDDGRSGRALIAQHGS